MGVCFNKSAKKSYDKIKYKCETIHLGYFSDINEDIINRQLAEEILFKQIRSTKIEKDTILNQVLVYAENKILQRMLNKVS